jgi:hypothetical protein
MWVTSQYEETEGFYASHKKRILPQKMNYLNKNTGLILFSSKAKFERKFYEFDHPLCCPFY